MHYKNMIWTYFSMSTASASLSTIFSQKPHGNCPYKDTHTEKTTTYNHFYYFYS